MAGAGKAALLGMVARDETPEPQGCYHSSHGCCGALSRSASLGNPGCDRGEVRAARHTLGSFALWANATEWKLGLSCGCQADIVGAEHGGAFKCGARGCGIQECKGFCRE